MPIRVPGPWLGATPHLGIPRSASGSMAMYITILPSLRGRSHSISPLQEGCRAAWSRASTFAMRGPRPTSRDGAGGDLPDGGSRLVRAMGTPRRSFLDACVRRYHWPVVPDAGELRCLCSRRIATGIVLMGPWWIRFATIQP